MISIRPETPEDRDQVRRLTIEAFSGTSWGHQGEAELIDALRNSSPASLSLVAVADKELLGHVLFTPVIIRTPRGEQTGMGLGPISVSPPWQNRGVGSSLVAAGLERLAKKECPFVVALGHPEYYPRFGFQPAARYGISHGFAGLPQEVFFVFCADDQTLASLTGGRAYYAPEFGPQHT